MKEDIVQKINQLSQPERDAQKRHTVETHESVTIDSEGREVRRNLRKKSRRKAEPGFAKMYVADLAKLSGCNILLVLQIASRVDYKTNLVALTPRVRRLIAKECGYSSLGSLRNSVAALVKADVVKKIDGHEYMLNPNLFAKGGWEVVQRAREIYAAIEDRQTSSELVRQELSGGVVTGEDRKADEETADQYRLDCAYDDRMAREGFFKV